MKVNSDLRKTPKLRHVALFTLLLLTTLSNRAMALQYEVDIFGVTHRFRNPIHREVVKNTTTFNPGGGLSIVFDDFPLGTNLTPLIKLGSYSDSFGEQQYYLGGGLRSEFKVTKSTFFQINFGLGLIAGNDTIIVVDGNNNLIRTETSSKSTLTPLLTVGYGWTMGGKKVVIGGTSIDTFNEATLFTTIGF